MIWLLLLALPLQGFAAATMIHCGPNHHRMLATATLAHGEAPGHGASAAHAHPHQMALADDHAAAKSSDAGSDAPSVQQLDKLMKFKCSACAACCMGAALPTAAMAFEPFVPLMTPDSFVPTRHIGFVTDGPDRPPRLSLV
jgi:hypothetical protein